MLFWSRRSVTQTWLGKKGFLFNMCSTKLIRLGAPYCVALRAMWCTKWSSCGSHLLQSFFTILLSCYIFGCFLTSSIYSCPHCSCSWMLLVQEDTTCISDSLAQVPFYLISTSFYFIFSGPTVKLPVNCLGLGSSWFT